MLAMFPACNIVNAAEAQTGTLMILKELGIMEGDSYGNLNLQNYITRAEFTKMAVKASKYRNIVALNLNISPYKDVTFKMWYAPYVKAASDNGLVKGYSDGSFRPENTVLYEEAVTVLLRLLGYTDEDFGVSWPYGQMGMAESIGLCDNIECSIGQAMNRNGIAVLFGNFLRTYSKGTQNEYITELDYSITDDVILIATAKEDTSVGSDKIYTSAGTYKINSYFDYGTVGKKGTAVVKKNEELALFIANDQLIKEYTVYQVLDKSIVVMDNGEFTSVDLEKDLTVYNKSEKTSLKNISSSLTVGDTLTTYSNLAGVLDYGVVKTEELKGPYTVESSDWLTVYGFVNPAVNKNGKKATVSDIALNDVIYYSEKLNTVWAYSSKVTGVYEKAVPNKDNPTSVQISGVSYSIEGVNAFKKLSTGGEYAIGDTVTLILGKDGSIADITDAAAGGGIKYVVYSNLDGTILAYKDGVLQRFKADDSTDTYIKTSKSTFGSVKSSLSAGDIIYVVESFDGTVDYLTVEKDKLEGPYTVKSSDWHTAYPADVAVMKNGNKTDVSAVNMYDIIYCSEDLGMIFAYSDTVTGIYESASPNKDTPVSVTVSGVSYTLEGLDAFSKLSSGGDYNFGDTVTLLLGKDGDVADVKAPASSDDYIYGYLTETGTKNFTDSSGTYSSYYATIVKSDGKTATYAVKSDYSTIKNKVVLVSFSGKYATMSTAKSDSVSGLFSADKGTIGSTYLADNAGILEISTTDASVNGVYSTVYKSRLDGVNIKSSQIVFARKNAKGSISELFIKDVTGDLNKYGMVTSVPSNNSAGGSYTVDINGAETTVSNSKTYSVYSWQPCKIIYSGNEIETLTPLSKLGTSVKSVTETTCKSGTQEYLLSLSVSAYVRASDYTYMMISLKELIDKQSDYTVYAYYDSLASSGGRIRVLTAIPK